MTLAPLLPLPQTTLGGRLGQVSFIPPVPEGMHRAHSLLEGVEHANLIAARLDQTPAHQEGVHLSVTDDGVLRSILLAMGDAQVPVLKAP
jgi:hypothetical protein